MPRPPILPGDAGTLADVGWRLTGSADPYGEDGRLAFNSNFITCHDGFTLHDLVSYNGKHNERNGENNRDGSDDNHSWNCGAEGPTTDRATVALRKQMMKNFACHLLFSSRTMILGGDEFARTQQGNNNAYCQDKGITTSSTREARFAQQPRTVKPAKPAEPITKATVTA